MKINTLTLTGMALNYAVALAEKHIVVFAPAAAEPAGVEPPPPEWMIYDSEGEQYRPLPDYVAAGGEADEIIDREMISTQVFDLSGPDERRWNAYLPGLMPTTSEEEINGPDRRTAAMRCWVSSCLGEQIDIPEELL